ncbi:MAG: hypothetical protein WCY98_11025 [Castellaniella sp.]
MQPPSSAISSVTPRLRWIARLAWLTFLLVFLITSLSAWLRLSGRLPGCEPWPGCLEADAAVGAARALHRMAASASLLVIIAMVLLSSLPRPALRVQRASALALLGLALFLAVLGALTGRSQAGAVVLGNLLGGMLMLGLAVQLAGSARRQEAGPPAAWTGLAIGLTLIQMALGGLAGMTDETLSMMHALHILLALLLIPVLVVGAWRLVRGRRRASAVLILSLTVLQIALGSVIVIDGPTIMIVTMHNMTAGGLLAVLFHCRT